MVALAAYAKPEVLLIDELGYLPIDKFGVLRPTLDSDDRVTLSEGERGAVSHSCLGSTRAWKTLGRRRPVRPQIG